MNITVSNPSDPRTGYLSNSSHYGFFMNNKWFPTVEHYIQAKKFSGTIYEDEIREAKTVLEARRKARSQF
jgi:predicted NAD-dependent protein-ADP-ribosyltransferase YbiA (DUF1768 family)